MKYFISVSIYQYLYCICAGVSQIIFSLVSSSALSKCKGAVWSRGCKTSSTPTSRGDGFMYLLKGKRTNRGARQGQFVSYLQTHPTKSHNNKKPTWSCISRFQCENVTKNIGSIKFCPKPSVIVFITSNISQWTTYFLFIMDERSSLRTEVSDQTGKHRLSSLCTLQTEGNACANTLLTLHFDITLKQYHRLLRIQIHRKRKQQSVWIT